MLILVSWTTAVGKYKHYTLSDPWDCSEQKEFVQTYIEKESLHNAFSSGNIKENLSKNMCFDCALLNHLDQCISDMLRARQRAAQNVLLDMLLYGALRERFVAQDNDSGQRRKQISVLQKCLMKMLHGKKNWKCCDGLGPGVSE